MNKKGTETKKDIVIITTVREKQNKYPVLSILVRIKI